MDKFDAAWKELNDKWREVSEALFDERPSPGEPAGATSSTGETPPAAGGQSFNIGTAWQRAAQHQYAEANAAAPVQDREPDYVMAEEDQHAEYLKKILAKVDELLNDVGLLLENGGEKEPGFAKDGSFRPGGPKPLAHGQAKPSRTKEVFKSVGAEVIRAAVAMGF